ncbi:MAG: ferritin-like domain-containing protein [Bacteroidota bacterium]|nr:ferritin-like domain-containing protein [Bacteroidota bacterium]
MESQEKEIIEKAEKSSMLNTTVSRKKFLLFSGVSLAAIGLGLQGCSDDDPITPPPAGSVDVGSGDVGVLNYAYALEQLEAAFYIQVTSSFYGGATAAEIAILQDIRDHEIAHRDFFKAAIGTAAIPSLEVDFSTINFTNRASVLNTAKAFEDLGVSAYNGAGYLLQDATYLELAGKIVSVEARHAAAIRDLLNPRSADFAGNDVVDAAGLDVQRLPSAVLAIAGTYIATNLTANSLP